MSSIADLMKFRFQRRDLRDQKAPPKETPSLMSTTSQKSTEAEPAQRQSGSTQSSGMFVSSNYTTDSPGVCGGLCIMVV